jgi:hypothetical protein
MGSICSNENISTESQLTMESRVKFIEPCIDLLIKLVMDRLY